MSAVIDTLKATLQAAPDSWQCRLALVEALVAEDRVEEASSLLHGISELPVDLDERAQAARAYGWIDPASGIEVLDGIISEMPSFAPAHYEKAVIFARSQDLEKAKQHYYTSATLDPDLANADLEAQLGLEETLVRETAPPPQPPIEEAPAEAEAHPTEASPPETAPPETPLIETEEPHTPPPPPASVPAAAGEGYIPTPQEIHEVPVITLREALGLPPIRPLVNPEEIPERPPLAYEEAPVYHQPAHTPEEEFRQNLSNVELRPEKLPEPVVYDYQAPDDSIFEPSVGDEDIYVGAIYDESGAKIDDLFENLNKRQKEQSEQIAAAEKRDKANAFVVASIAMTAICALLVMVVSAVPRPAPPQIIATTPVASQEDSLDNQQLNKPEMQKQPMPSSASSMSMDVMEVAAVSDLSMPAFDSPTLSPGMATMGNDFGMSMSFGDTGGGGAMFFGGRSSGQRFLFVLDHSMSMQPHQVELRNNELEKTLKGLRGVRYHVMLFAGGVYYVDKGWQAAKKQPTKYPTVFESPDGTYSFKDNGLFDFKLQGDPKDFPSPRWLTATPSNIRRSIEEVKKAKKFGGTDWDTALQIAHLMDPPPDVIFFMTDGIDRQIDTSQIVRNSRGNGKPKINCVAMQTAAAQEQFSEIARRTNGAYTIVDKDGEPIDGFKFMKNPKDFKGRL